MRDPQATSTYSFCPTIAGDTIIDLFSHTFERSSEAIIITDKGGQIIDVNPAYLEITGFKKEEIVGQKSCFHAGNTSGEHIPQAVWHELQSTNHWAGEAWDRRANGEAYPKWLSLSVIRSQQGEILYILGIFSDISAQKDTEERLRKLAFYDPLTGLPNRTLFIERLDRALKNAQRYSHQIGLLFIDLDRFKYVNDTLGHAMGDQLLITIAQRLKECLRAVDTISRLGGDEFTVILPNVENINGISYVADRIIETISEKVRLGKHDVHVGASIGISIFPGDGKDIDTLTKNADAAMYHAKENGRNNFQFFTKEIAKKIQTRLALEKQLRNALENNEFILYYQPQFDLKKQTLTGTEALIRWQRHPNETPVSPSQFIPIAEETGLILSLGEWVLHTSCKQLHLWKQQGINPGRLFINLSARQFQHKALLDQIKAQLNRYNLQPSDLGIEISEETMHLQDHHATATFHALKSLGIHVALDDFGTGYSSLSQLKTVPLASLKIDQSFITNITQKKNDRAIVSAIVSMAKKLNLNLTAEGVETVEQLMFLGRQGCNEVQGFLFSPPLPTDQYTEFLSRKNLLKDFINML
ncbi:putative bifunctional diguanylate cyclase/phosphodiesterase [Magnetococcales bacterium HHB-1]